MVEAVTMNSSALTITKRSAARALIFPAGISRSAVRGLALSMRRSAQRLNPMAALRAKTMHRMTCTRTMYGQRALRAKTMQSNTCKSSTTQPYLPEQSEEIPSVRSA